MIWPSPKKPCAFCRIFILLCRLQESRQVGQILDGQLLIKPLGHDRHWAGAKLLEIGARDHDLPIGAGDEHDAFRIVAAKKAIVAFSGVRERDIRFKALREAGAGEDDGFEQVALGADLADAGEVGPDLAADVADGVTGDAGGFRAVEDRLAAANVAPGQAGLKALELAFCLAASPLSLS